MFFAEVSVIDDHAARMLTIATVNEILGDHNVDKQMTDSKGDVSSPLRHFLANTRLTLL